MPIKLKHEIYQNLMWRLYDGEDPREILMDLLLHLDTVDTEE